MKINSIGLVYFGLVLCFVIMTAGIVSASTTIIPYGDSGYKYKVVSHGEGAGFESIDYDDSGFFTGTASFGTNHPDCLSLSPYIKTQWPLDTDILLRKEFYLPEGTGDLKVYVTVDNDVQVFINGHNLGSRKHDYCPNWDDFVFLADHTILNIDGPNIIAVRGIDRGSASFLDIKVIASELVLPKIEDITVKGPMGDANPVTTEEVTLDAKIKYVPGYEITKVSWSGDGIPANAEGKIYTYTPSMGSHGNKNVQATITYKNTATAAIGQDVKTKEFKLFFIKNGDDDYDGQPNWFDYWNLLNVGDRHGVKFVIYDPNLKDYGNYSRGKEYVRISSLAAKKYTTKSREIPQTELIGIDTFTIILTHECLHYYHWYAWLKGQPLSIDMDGDWLPNWYEDVGADGIPGTKDSGENNSIFDKGNSIFKGETYDVNNNYTYGYTYGYHLDDEELVVYGQTDNNRGPYSQDWASPGKQTTPPEQISIFTNAMTSSTGMWEDKWSPLPSPPAKFNGIYSDYGTDTNSDKLYNYLNIEVGLDVMTAGSYFIGCGLEDSNGNTIWANNTVNLNTGTQSVKLKFDGLTIRQHRVNGPYSLVLLNLYNESETLVDYVDVAYNTSAYNYLEFQTPSQGLLSDNYVDIGKDIDGDGLYDYLTVKVGVNAKTAGEYTIKGWLYDSNGTSIIMANNTTSLDGGSQLVSLNFDGLTLRQHRNNGPYYLKDLILYDGDGKEIDFILNAYTTSEYHYTDFQNKGAQFIGNCSDHAKDTDGDGFYNYLTVNVGVDIPIAGKYSIKGWLYDGNGTEISMASRDFVYLNAGIRSVELNVSGLSIYKHGIDGPYYLKNVMLFDEEGNRLDGITDAYSTSAYRYTDFQNNRAEFTGNYSDHGKDTDSDGFYNYLTLNVGVDTLIAGKYSIKGWLYDGNGTEISMASSDFVYLNTGIRSVELNISGLSIYNHGIDGPYYLKNIMLFDEEGNKLDGITDANSTSAYNHKNFGSLLLYDTTAYDNQLNELSPTSIISSSSSLGIGKSSSRYRDVMWFNLSMYNTTDTISKATLSLYWYYPAGATRTSDTEVEIYRPVSWDQKYVSWKSRLYGTLWATAGGNWFDKNGVSQGTNPYASVTFAGSKVPDNKYYEFNVTQLVQEYVSGEHDNTGFFLKAKNEGSSNCIAFYSLDWSNAAQKPKLTITKATGSADNPPVAKFSSNVTEGYVPLSVQFIDLSENVTSWTWNFGDGTPVSSEQNPVYVYMKEGTYTVSLNSSNSAGYDVETKINYINVTDWNPWNNPDSAGGESIALSELQTAIYDWRFGIALSNGEKVDLTRLQGLIYSWRFGY